MLLGCQMFRETLLRKDWRDSKILWTITKFQNAIARIENTVLDGYGVINGHNYET